MGPTVSIGAESRAQLEVTGTVPMTMRRITTIVLSLTVVLGA